MAGNKNSGRKSLDEPTESIRITMTIKKGDFVRRMAKQNKWTPAQAAREIFEMGLESLDKKR